MTKKKPKAPSLNFYDPKGMTMRVVFEDPFADPAGPLPPVPKLSLWQQIKAYFTL